MFYYHYFNIEHVLIILHHNHLDYYLLNFKFIEYLDQIFDFEY
jgi:hypothetical protein